MKQSELERLNFMHLNFCALNMQEYALNELRQLVHYKAKNKVSKELTFVKNQLNRHKAASSTKTSKEFEEINDMMHDNIGAMCAVAMMASRVHPDKVDAFIDKVEQAFKEVE